MIVTQQIELKTRGHGDLHDITSEVARHVRDSGIRSGIVTLFTPSSTSALTTIEYESGVVRDLAETLERMVPSDIDYHHNLRWGDGNGYAHVRHALLGPSLTVPFMDARLHLGTWQQIVFIDFDNRPRQRALVVQIMGEA
jgi:secondary thiamine-phosphate synthase enzyme